MNAYFVSDPSLVYIDRDGAIRVRGIVYVKRESSNEQGPEKLFIEVGKVQCRYVEYIVTSTDKAADYYGLERWKVEPYTVLQTIALESAWRTPDEREAALELMENLNTDQE